MLCVSIQLLECQMVRALCRFDINLVQTVAPGWRQIESEMALDLIKIPAVSALTCPRAILFHLKVKCRPTNSPPARLWFFFSPESLFLFPPVELWPKTNLLLPIRRPGWGRVSKLLLLWKHHRLLSCAAAHVTILTTSHHLISTQYSLRVCVSDQSNT